MEKCDYDENKIINRIKQLAFLNKGIKLIYINEKLNQKNTFVYEGGLKEYVTELNKDKNPLSANIIYGDIKRDVLVNKGTEETYCIACEIAFQYNKGYSSSVYSFCNNIHTSEGGSHEEGFKFAITKIINKYAIDKKFLKEAERNVDHMAKKFKQHVKVKKMVIPGLPSETIIRVAEEEDVDLIIIAASGKSGLHRFFIGSVAEKVLKNSERDVLLIHN